MLLKNKIAQSTTEYAIILAVVAAGLVAMQVYVKRGIQGRLRNLADQISPAHYEQTKTSSTFNIEQAGRTETRYDSGQSITETPQNWNDASGVRHKGEEVKRWGSETTEPEVE